MKYADIIIDISAGSVDKAYTYAVPDELLDTIGIGVRVRLPFGAHDVLRDGFVIGLKDRTEVDASKLKTIKALAKGKTDVNEELIKLAAAMAKEYGCTMNQALMTVLPVKSTVRKNSRRTDPIKVIAEDAGAKHKIPNLNFEQERVYQEILKEDKPSLLYGITGSGKTRIYIELIETMRKMGKQTIVLIPEISLTYQTVRELISYLGGGISVMHSRLSKGERYEQYMKALKGETDVIVGPRSALFTPFSHLGLIIIDEEHERTYLSDTAPRYDARQAAEWRAKYNGAKLVLGSATPSLESYKRALGNRYVLHKLKNRANQDISLPKVHVIDMREELNCGNRSIFSDKLSELINDRLKKKEQVMLFLNRRGYAGFVSCRSCGTAIKCPHCDVSLTVHNSWFIDEKSGKKSPLLTCHYCGFRAPMPKTCPVCSSRFIAPFGTGTEKLEAYVKKQFQSAKVIRMDADTTARKGQYERILSDFYNRKADILIGTQMIVKGHDFPHVTLVGIVAADLSLNSPEYDAAERTFQLITQAAGRSGRGEVNGDVVIQSYDPSHYAITCAAKQDYESFYEREMAYRKILKYPPESRMLFMRFKSEDEKLLEEAADYAAKILKNFNAEGLEVIGPCNEAVYKIKDQHRKIIYIKHMRHDIIIKLRDKLCSMLFEKIPQKKVFISTEIR